MQGCQQDLGMLGRAYLHTLCIVIVISGDNDKKALILLSFVVITMPTAISSLIVNIIINNGNKPYC